MKNLIVVVILVFSINLSFGQSEEQTYTETLETMFQLAGTQDTYQAAITQMMSMYKQQFHDVDAEIWNQLENEFLKASIKDLVKMLTPVYEKYLTQADLEAINAFYRSPAGVKLGKNTPMITQESMAVGQEWGMQIAQKLIEKLEAEAGKK